jgi:hypothetical protein
MPQQFLHHLEFMNSVPTLRNSVETCASQCICGFQPSRQLVEPIFVKLLGPKMDANLGAVCSRKPSHQHLCNLIVSPLQKSIGNKRMDRYRLLRRFGLAWTNNTVNDGSRCVHRSLGEVDVAPFQAEQLALPQACGYCQENQRPFSVAEILDQSSDFSWHPNCWCLASLRTLADEVDRTAVEQLVTASVIEQDGHQVPNLRTTALRVS